MIVLIAPLAGGLTDRVGARPLMVAGLSLTTLSLFLQTRIDVDTGYGLLLPAFILLGIGMALVMSPMSTAAMNAVSADKAGVASGVLLDEPHGGRNLRRRRRSARSSSTWPQRAREPARRHGRERGERGDRHRRGPRPEEAPRRRGGDHAFIPRSRRACGCRGPSWWRVSVS